MNPEIVGLIGICILVVLLFLRMPIGIAMLLIGFLGFAYLNDFETAGANLGLVAYREIASYSLAIIPLFVLMGNLASHVGLIRGLYKSAYEWVGSLPGGLAMATVLACGGFASICGSSFPAAVTMASIALPEMRRYNYHPELSAGCITAGATLGILIPPSLGFVLYSILTEESVGRLFIAGILPGVLEVFIFIVVIYVLCLRKPEMGPPALKRTIKEKVASLPGSMPILALFLLVMGGIYMGVFTPSEAGAIGAFGALIIPLAGRRLSLKGIIDSLLATGQTTCMMMFMLIGAMLFMRFIAVSNLASTLADLIKGLEVSRYLILAGVTIFYIILGMFLDIISGQILTIPIIYPIMIALGFDGVWFGVLMVIMSEMGLITPPVGMTTFAFAGAAKVPVNTVFKGAIPFCVGILVLVALLIIFPQIALFLPNMMKG